MGLLNQTQQKAGLLNRSSPSVPSPQIPQVTANSTPQTSFQIPNEIPVTISVPKEATKPSFPLQGTTISSAPVQEVSPIRQLISKISSPFVRDIATGVVDAPHKILFGDPQVREQIKELESKGYKVPFTEDFVASGLMPFVGKTQEELIDEKAQKIIKDTGVTPARAYDVATADTLKRKLPNVQNIGDLEGMKQADEYYNSLGITDEEKSSLRTSNIIHSLMTGLDIAGNLPVGATVENVTKGLLRIAESKDAKIIADELVKLGVPKEKVGSLSEVLTKVDKPEVIHDLIQGAVGSKGGLLGRSVDKVTDPIQINEIKQTIKEGEDALATKTYQGAEITQDQADEIARSIDNAKARIGEEVSSTPKPVSDTGKLIDEAKKYKSAKEFTTNSTELTYKNLQENPYSIKAYGKDFNEPVEYYRAGAIRKNGDIWLTDNQAGAQQYSSAGGGTKVGSYIVNSKKPLIIDTAGGKYAKGNIDINKILTKEEIAKGYTNNPDIKQKFIDYAKNNGYDAVQFADSFPDGEGGMRSLVVWDKNRIKTKSQLTDIWNKANETKEAKKYKSADEFVKNQGESIFRGEGGENVSQGKALLAEGKHFAYDAEYPKAFGEVSEHIIKPNAKILDLGDSTFEEISKKLGIPEKKYISPKDLSTIAKEKGYDAIKYNGEYKSSGKPFTHFVDLHGDSTIKKSDLIDLWNKTNKKFDGIYTSRTPEEFTQAKTIEEVYKPRTTLPKSTAGYHMVRDENNIKKILKDGFSLKGFGKDSGSADVGDPKGAYFFPSKSVEVVESSAKELPKEIKIDQNLIDEAKKYKSAEEFIDEIYQDENVLGKILKTEKVPVSEIKMSHGVEEYGKDYPDNLKLGAKFPPIIINEKGKILDGNQRYNAYVKNGVKEIDVYRVKGDSLTDIWNKANETKPIQKTIEEVYKPRTPEELAQSKTKLEKRLDAISELKKTEEKVKKTGRTPEQQERLEGLKSMKESIESTGFLDLRKFESKRGEFKGQLNINTGTGKFAKEYDTKLREVFHDSDNRYYAEELVDKYENLKNSYDNIVDEIKQIEKTTSLQKQGQKQFATTPIEVTSVESKAEEYLLRTPDTYWKDVLPFDDIVNRSVTDVKDKINILDYIRTPDRVLSKIGFDKEAKLVRQGYEAYLKELPKNIDKITEWSKRVPSKESNLKIFQYLDGKDVALNSEETKVAGEIRAWLQEWAKRLNLPDDKQITHYITHIFDKELIAKEFDEDLAKIIAERIPSQVYDPFLEKRLGKLGYKQDTWEALDAYVKRATRKANMDPALEAMQTKAGSSLEFSKLEKSQFEYIKNYIDRVNMRPTWLDEQVDNAIKSMFGYRFGQRPVTYLTRLLRQLTYRGMLGLNPTSALRNISQGVNTYAKLGEKYTALGYLGLFKKGALQELKDTGVLADSFIQDRALSSTKKAIEAVDKGLFAMFQTAETINRGSAYFGAKAKALAEGMTPAEAIEYAKKVVRDTQFSFGSIDTPVGLQSDLTKTLLQFQNYTVKQIEFLTEMAKNKEYAGLMRYALGGLAFVYTIGQAFNMKPEQLIPTFRFDTPPSLKFPVEVAKAVADTPDKYNQDRDIETKLADIGNSLLGLIPAGSQIKKTVEGLIAIQKGASVDKGGNIQYEIPQTTEGKIQTLLFGKSSTEGAKKYFDRAEQAKKDMESIQPIYDQIQELKNAGKNDEAIALYDALGEKGKEVYKKIKAQKKSEQTKEGKLDLLPTFQKIRSLKEEGKTEEAIQMYDSLTDEQKKYYQLLKKQLEGKGGGSPKGVVSFDQKFNTQYE